MNECVTFFSWFINVIRHNSALSVLFCGKVGHLQICMDLLRDSNLHPFY